MKNQLARMVTNLEASRALLYRTCALVDRNHSIRAHLDREQDLPIRRARALRGDLRAQRRAHPAAHAAREVPRDRGLRRDHARRDPGARRARLHVRVGAGQAPRRRDHHDDLRGHLADPGLVRAEGGGQGRARRGVRRGAPRSRQPRRGPSSRRTPTACARGSSWCSRRAARWRRTSVMRCSPRSRWPRTSRASSSRASCCCQANHDPSRFDVAASWIERRMVDLEGRTERIRAARPDLIARCARMIEQAVPE